jgi:hypothetical protein
MILSIETDNGRPAVWPIRRSPAPLAEASCLAPGSGSLDDLVAMCRALGVGTGLLRACQRDAVARTGEAGDLVTASCRVA